MTPRPKVERVARSIRLRKDADEELQRRAEAVGLSVNAYLEQLVTGSFVEDTPVGPRKRWPTVVPGVVIEDLSAGGSCPHPRKSRQVFSWGSKCGDCGRRL